MADANVTENIPHAKLAAEYLEGCSDAFGSLAAILKAIVKEAPEHSDIRKLAGAGLMISEDYESLADCWREEVMQ